MSWQRFAVLLPLIVLILGTYVEVDALRYGSPNEGRTYSVAEIQTGLSQQPTRWLGRVLNIYGSVQSLTDLRGTGIKWEGGAEGMYSSGEHYSWSGSYLVQPMFALSDADATSISSPPLWVTIPRPAPLLSLLHHIPMLGQLMPRQLTTLGPNPAIYQVRLQDLAGSCGLTRCYGGALANATSPW